MYTLFFKDSPMTITLIETSLVHQPQNDSQTQTVLQVWTELLLHQQRLGLSNLVQRRRKCGEKKCKHKLVWMFEHTSRRVLSFSSSGSVVKNLPAVQQMWVQSLGWEDPPEDEMATHSSILAWETPWTEESGGLQFMGLQKSGARLSG